VLVGCFGTPTPLAPGLTGSVGLPHHGVQTGAVELPRRGEGFVRYRPFSKHYWGNPRLVDAIQRVASEMALEHAGGAPLVVGDLSARHGGKIPGHNSHRTGRDVDLLWYVTTPEGAPVVSPGFVRVGADGLASVEGGADSKRWVRLDVERQWILFRKLLADPQIGVQFLFVSREVEALLVEYALSRGEDLELLWHAQTVMLQPGDSAPHDDHVHMRVACTPDEAINGCEGGGPHWQWLPPRPALGPLDGRSLREIAQDDPFDLEALATGDSPAGGGA
jgi:penicillin-insensitive murein endopeptidase